MCNSQAEGGQRCHAVVAAALTVAETKYNTLVEEAGTYTSTGRAVPGKLRTAGMQAAYDREDALARYASTAKGETDLNARMAALMINGKAPGPYGPTANAHQEYHDYAEAISEGGRLRAKAKDIHDSVKAGMMSNREAVALAQYPPEWINQYRQQRIGSSKDMPANPNNLPKSLEVRRSTLKTSTDATIASTANEVKAAVSLIAATVRDKYPNAKTVELEGSDQGDYLNVISIDGDDSKLYDLENGTNGASDDLSWASSCIYDAHRDASPALHSSTNQHLNRTDSLYININEALNNR